ncbi:MAG TPA: hypothetical protein VFC07_10555, partial [Verrucomicrobiae bacterium]|nr:hypothetical protein [Verrucomicrobiae bacterium]
SFDESLAGGVAELALQDGIHVANASIGGHAALNQFEFARWLHEDKRLAVSNYVLLVTPLMVQYSDSYTRTSVGKDGRLYEDPSDRLAYVRLWIKTHFVLYNRLRDAIRNAGIGSRPKDDMPSVFRLFGTGDSEEVSHRKFGSYLKQVKAFADKQGAGMRIVYVPLTVEADFDSVRNTAERKGVKLDQNLPARVCATAAAELGIPLQDLRPVLKQLHEQGDPLRLKGDFHYDRILSKACAASIWSKLRNEPGKTAYHHNEMNIKSAYGN